MNFGHFFTDSRRALCDGPHTACRRGCAGYQRLARVPLMVLGLAAFAAINSPALAQTTTSGPVHYPAPGTASPTTVAAPAATLVTPPSATNAVVSPVAPILSAPANAAQVPVTTGDIRDIRGVMSIPYEWLWAAYAVIALVVAGLLYAAWRFFRRKTAAKAKLPYEIALEKLEAARALLTVETVREYAFTVSEIIRVYIEQRFGEKAARRTTEEFLSDLLAQTGTPLAQHRALLEDFLNHCDLIKFARWGASERELESMHESARAFILDTRPQPEPVHAAKAVATPQPVLAQAK